MVEGLCLGTGSQGFLICVLQDTSCASYNPRVPKAEVLHPKAYILPN